MAGGLIVAGGPSVTLSYSHPPVQDHEFMDKIVELLHQILDLLPWHSEADKLAAHAKAEEVVQAPAEPAEPVGRNTTPSGVVTGEQTPETPETGGESAGA